MSGQGGFPSFCDHNNGGDHEDAAQPAVIIWRRRQFDDASREGFRTNDLGSLTRPAHAAGEPGRSHASAATSPHHQSQFARPFIPWGSSMAGGPHGLLPQRGSPASIIHDQRDDRSLHGDCTPGRQVRRCCDHLPARGQGVGLPHVGRSHAVGFSRPLTLPRKTSPGFGRGAFSQFGLRGCVNTHLARFHAHGDCRLKCLAKGLPRHFSASLRKYPLRPEHHGRSKKGWRHQILVMRFPK